MCGFVSRLRLADTDHSRQNRLNTSTEGSDAHHINGETDNELCCNPLTSGMSTGRRILGFILSGAQMRISSRTELSGYRIALTLLGISAETRRVFESGDAGL